MKILYKFLRSCTFVRDPSTNPHDLTEKYAIAF